MPKQGIVLVGAGGYGNVYTRMFLDEPFENAQLIAVVDPYAATAPDFARLQAADIPIYDTMAACFARHAPALVIICTPTPLHAAQCVEAMHAGADVLCEKPLAPTLQALDLVRQAARETGRHVTVGFQWSSFEPMRVLKRRILDGEFGKARQFRTLVSWPRGWQYYARGWAAKKGDAANGYVLDSILANATAHYAHNMLFLLGNTMEAADEVTCGKAACYRGNDIEMFDTVVLRAQTQSGCALHYYATHLSSFIIDPTATLVFERAVVTLGAPGAPWQLTLHHADGRVEQLATLSGASGMREKVEAALATVQTGVPSPCTPATCAPHLRLCNALCDQVAIRTFPADLIRKDETRQLTYVPMLHLALHECYEQWKLPSELGFTWAAPEEAFDLSGYTRFEGRFGAPR